MLTTEMIERRLDLSIPMLDQHYAGWHRKDPNTINIEYDNTCVLGRCAGSFNEEVKKAAGRGIQPEEFAGIFAGDIPEGPRRKLVYAQLTAAIRVRMRMRQARERLLARLQTRTGHHRLLAA